MTDYQTGILLPVPKLGRYLYFSILADADAGAGLQALQTLVDGEQVVIGIGQSLVTQLGKEIPGLKDFPVMTGAGLEVPSIPAAVWVWLRAQDRGELLHRSRRIEEALDGFILTQVVDSFMYGNSLDLSGYEDGTENPQAENAVAAAIVSGRGEGLDGSSFVAVQQWMHDLDYFESLSAAEQDDVFGRRKKDNEEFDEAPPSAHVKRTAQESFSPEAFVVRRSMPWTEGMDAGLMFVAFGHSFAAFEAILKRMLGLEDGIADGLFSFTRPLSGAYFWCPPVRDGRLDLRALGV